MCCGMESCRWWCGGAGMAVMWCCGVISCFDVMFCCGVIFWCGVLSCRIVGCGVVSCCVVWHWWCIVFSRPVCVFLCYVWWYGEMWYVIWCSEV